ncbi:transferase [Aureococcus anophagefferens]|nr:transferase [Aureococcus anophagefferens]
MVATASMRFLSHRIAFAARRRAAAARSQRTLASSRRAAAMASFKVMEVLNKANLLEASGASIMHMEVGQPSSPAPPSARRAAEAELAVDAAMGYTSANGLPELKNRIARWYADRHGSAVDPERVVVTTGSSAGFVLSFMALWDAGDKVEAAAAGDGIAGLILSSPSNPTGALSGELSRRATCGTRAFSKFFSMTGWRVGWLVLPAGDAELAGAVARLQQNLFINAPTVSQIAATAAFDDVDGARRPQRGGKLNVNVQLDDFFAFSDDVELEALVQFDDLIDDHTRTLR